MKCPNCGTENDDTARFCQMCARPLGPSYPTPYIATQPRPKSETTALVIVVVVVVILIVLGTVVALMLATVPKADFRDDLSYTALNHWFGMVKGGTVTVTGTIYNYGDEAGDCAVSLHIYDGYVWHYYLVPIGVILPGGEMGFDWSANFDPMDANLVQVQHTLMTH